MAAKRNPSEKDDGFCVEPLPASVFGIPDGQPVGVGETRQDLIEQLNIEIEKGLEDIRQGWLVSADEARERLFSKRGDES